MVQENTHDAHHMPHGRVRLAHRPSIAFVGDYVPRRCGIATFTADLCESVAGHIGENEDAFVVAMNDVSEGYPYPPRVRFEVRQAVQADYRLAAEFLNIHQVSTVCVQHEYGIYGGIEGSHLLSMLKLLRRPIVTTLHTVLKNPSDRQRMVMEEIGRLSDRLVVMSETARGLLADKYSVPAEKVAMIPHGIPDVPFIDPSYYKDQFGVEGRKVLLTFGLLSPGKGIEYAIDALPRIVKKHPEVVYVVLGATHPQIRRESGEAYRNSLQRRVGELGLNDHVIFQNRFVEIKELCEYLGAADVYLTPYLNAEQITSGTLAYALGAGKAVVSTPYWYAEEMLANDRGVLVDFQDPDSIADAVIDLLDNETRRHAIRKTAYNFCRSMVWPEVGRQYLKLFEQARDAWVGRLQTPIAVGRRRREAPDADADIELPEADLRHFYNIIDDTGMLQHSLYATPDRSHGYCTDDNARALVVAAMYWDQAHDERIIRPMQTFLSFLAYALNEDTGRFRNFMGYDRRWSEQVGSEDSHARALWGLGQAVALCPYESMIALATNLFKVGLPATEQFVSPRAWAFTIVGIHSYLRRFSGDSDARRCRALLAEKLGKHFMENMQDDWPWCEDTVTYSNAKLPHALIMAGKWMQKGEYIDIGQRALSWLLDVQTSPAGVLSLIGNDGWFTRGGEKAAFDQQPIEANALVDACVEAYRVTGDRSWIRQAYKSLNWFLGENDLRTPLYDFTTGGCRDGLHADRVNENQGAESTLAWLMSLLLMQDLQSELAIGQTPPEQAGKQRPVRRAIRSPGPVVEGKQSKPKESPNR
ncbi:MAG: glycosyltransferase family 4 protein [Phycisphaerae bacterium]